mgnify:CR=1 FL=1
MSIRSPSTVPSQATFAAALLDPLAPCPPGLRAWNGSDPLRRLAVYRNSLSPVIPQRVLDRPPSAELRPDQTDQDSLPPYDLLDAILQAYVEEDHSVEELVAAGFDRATVERVARLVIVNEYKRRQAAPGVRITPRAFGRDRRYPITSGFRR